MKRAVTMTLRSSRNFLVCAFAGSSLALFAAPAPAAVTVGQTVVPNVVCSADQTRIQRESVGGVYTVPSPGVISSFSFQADASPPQIKFKLARPIGGNDFKIVGESAAVTPPPNLVTAFPVRVSAQPGDVLGFYQATGGGCGVAGTMDRFGAVTGDLPPESSDTFGFGFATLDVAATLEPDVDADGFGDETQDGCPSDATAQGACPAPPKTKIVKGPKKRTDKPRAKFKFASSVAGSTFECRLKGRGVSRAIKRFRPCESPRRYRGLDGGKYKFFVFAIGPTGLADASPATRRFKFTG